MIWILFYYNSLPDMPSECPLFTSDVMHRDFFMCNPTNTGHYQYPKFENLSYDEICHKRKVCSFLEKSDLGYFKVGEEIANPRGFFASESILLPKHTCIEINYSSRGIPVSWGHSSVKDDVSRILRRLQHIRTRNISEKYADETRKIMSYLNNIERMRELINICEECDARGQCYWGKKRRENRISKLMSLYG
jgi:hypothetical protein